jgi:hypothetical protein
MLQATTRITKKSPSLLYSVLLLDSREHAVFWFLATHCSLPPVEVATHQIFLPYLFTSSSKFVSVYPPGFPILLPLTAPRGSQGQSKDCSQGPRASRHGPASTHTHGKTRNRDAKGTLASKLAWMQDSHMFRVRVDTLCLSYFTYKYYVHIHRAIKLLFISHLPYSSMSTTLRTRSE